MMSEERKQQIALALLKDRAKQKGITLMGLKRELGNAAKRTGIPLGELEDFVKVAVSEIVEEVLK